MTDEGYRAAVTLTRRFGSAANLNVHPHCRVLDGGYRSGADRAAELVDAALLTSSSGSAADDDPS